MLAGLCIFSSLTPVEHDAVASALNGLFPDLVVDGCRASAADLALRNADIPSPQLRGRRVLVSAERWLEVHTDPAVLDPIAERAASSGAFTVWLWGADLRAPDLLKSAREVATRCQRFLHRRNACSRTALFARIVAAHRAYHDLSLPLVAADYAHALDTHGWLLRLCPDATQAVQVAALFHDFERLASESLQRIEHHAPDYAAFKQAHARSGAALAVRALRLIGAPGKLLERVEELIAGHERPSGDAELALLNEADALSFFSLNASGFLAYYGLEHTRLKVRYTLARLGARGRAALGTFRHHPVIGELLAAEAARTNSAAPRRAGVRAP